MKEKLQRRRRRSETRGRLRKKRSSSGGGISNAPRTPNGERGIPACAGHRLKEEELEVEGDKMLDRGGEGGMQRECVVK